MLTNSIKKFKIADEHKFDPLSNFELFDTVCKHK